MILDVTKHNKVYCVASENIKARPSRDLASVSQARREVASGRGRENAAYPSALDLAKPEGIDL